MPALKQLVLVILAAFVVIVGVLGYEYFRLLEAEREANDAALAVHNKVQTVIATGSTQTVSVSIPGGYVFRFENNQLKVVNHGKLSLALPEGGYDIPFADNCSELTGGNHGLMISLENNKVVVSRI